MNIHILSNSILKSRQISNFKKIYNIGLFNSFDQHKISVNGNRKLSTTPGVAAAPLTHSYVHSVGKDALLGETIGQSLQKRADLDGDKVAMLFRSQNVQLTFNELLEQADELAAGLMNLGVKRGDKVGICSHNCVEWILLQYATARAGIVLVNINPSYKPRELEFALRKVSLRVLFLAESFKSTRYYDIIAEVLPELPVMGGKVAYLQHRTLPDLKTIVMLSEHTFPGTINFSDVMEMGTTKERQEIINLQNKLQFDDPINIQFTSGTTGQPKGATLTHHNILNNSRLVGQNLRYDEYESKICLPVPLYHCFGMVMGSLQSITHGATCVFPGPGFDAVATLEAVQQERCTSLYGTPTMFIDMIHELHRHEYDTTSLRTGIMAGSSCPIEVMQNVCDLLHMPEVTICYGTTENSPVTFQSGVNDDIEKRVSTIGKVMPHTEAKIVDVDNNIVKIGEVGEMCIRGYCVMLGYYDDDQQTRKVIGKDGWYHSGDMASMDAEGYAKIVGRRTDLINRGGENVYPIEVENVIYTHPDVEEVQVIGVECARLGEEVCAWIKLEDNSHPITADDIQQFCKNKLSHFKIPKKIRFVTEFPMTVTGKIQKIKMREYELKHYKN